MLTITNTNQFIVRDFVEGYDNPYNEALIAQERMAAIQALGHDLVAHTTQYATQTAKRAGKALFEATELFLTSLN